MTDKTRYCENCAALTKMLDNLRKEIDYWKDEHSKQVDKNNLK